MVDAKSQIRVFIAIDPPQNVKAALARISGNLKNLGLARVNWVGLAGFHITVKFLGDVPSSQTGELLEAIERISQTLPWFVLNIGSVGVFPHPRSPRVLWIAIDHDAEPLIRMHRELEEAMSTLGISKECQPFRPHITLGRILRKDKVAVREQLSTAFEHIVIPSDLTWEVHSLSLMSSSFSHGIDGGYRRIAEIRLTGAL